MMYIAALLLVIALFLVICSCILSGRANDQAEETARLIRALDGDHR